MVSTARNSDEPDADVIVVGAGPVGLLMALKLGLGGVRTTVIEKHDKILLAPRAIAYLPTVNRELDKMGILRDLLKNAYCTDLGPCWRNIDTSIYAALGKDDPQAHVNLAGDIDHVMSKVDSITLMVGQEILAQVVLSNLETRCKDVVEVRFGTSCVGIQQFTRKDGLIEILTNTVLDSAQVKSEGLLTSKWVVGADGANSFVRKASCIPFQGTTWTNFRFTASDIEYKFDQEGDYRPINYIVHPEEWAVIARVGAGDVWRVAYGECTTLPEDDTSLLERSKERIPRYLPGSKEYKVRRLKPYTAQQRCAATFRKGHVILVGDAAHSNNPVGGLGLTSGILDAVAIGNSLVRCLRKNEGEEVVDNAASVRKSVWLEQVNPATQTNFKRLFSLERDAEGERATFFHRLNTDPTFSAQLGREIDDLFRHNFEG